MYPTVWPQPLNPTGHVLSRHLLPQLTSSRSFPSTRSSQEATLSPAGVPPGVPVVPALSPSALLGLNVLEI